MINKNDTKVSDKTTEKDIIKTLFSERDSYQQSNLIQRNTFDDIYRAYMGELDDAADKSKSQEKITKLNTEVNYIVPSIFSGQPEIEVEEIGEEDSDIATIGEKIINYRINTIDQAYEKIEAWVKQSVVFGTSLMKVNWKFELEGDENTKSVAVDEPDLEVPNIKDCFYNPIISNVCGQNSLIFRSVLSISEVKENLAYNFKDATGQLNRDKVEAKGNGTVDIYNSSTQVNSDLINLSKATEGTVEVYERVTEGRLQTVVDGKERLVLRDVAWNYGYINAVKLVHEPNAIPNRFEGLGVGHNTLGLTKLIQKLSNRLQDAVNLGNNPHFLTAKGSGIDKRQLVVRPGGATEVELEPGESLNNKIVPLQVPDIKNGALSLLDRFDDEHKRASGANDLTQGAASNKTLGQDQIASTYSSNRFELITRRFKQALADVGRMLLMMEIENIQSIDAPILKIFPVEAEITEQGELKYSRETVYQILINARDRKDLKFNISVKGETNVARNKDIQIKQLVDMYNLFAPSLPPQNQMAWARKLLELRGVDDIDELIPPKEQMQQQMQQQAQQQIDPNTGQPVDAQALGNGMPQQPTAM